MAIRTPASAGPTMRADWTMTLLRLTALTTRSGPTISITKLCRVGLSTALTAPRAKTAQVDHPRGDDAGGGDREQAERRQRHQRLGDDQQPPLREAVGEQAAPGAEEQHRQELQRRGHADRDAAAGEARGSARPRRPSASSCPRARRAGRRSSAGSWGPRASRRSGAGRRSEPLAPRSPSSMPLEDLGGALQRLHVVVRKVAHAARQVGVLAPAQAPQPLAAGGGDADQGAAAVGGVGRALDQALPSRKPSVRVAVGRLTRSISASSLGVSGPCRSTVASAAAEVGVSGRLRRRLLPQPPRRAHDRQPQPGGGVGEGGVWSCGSLISFGN